MHIDKKCKSSVDLCYAKNCVETFLIQAFCACFLLSSSFAIKRRFSFISLESTIINFKPFIAASEAKCVRGWFNQNVKTGKVC